MKITKHKKFPTALSTTLSACAAIMIAPAAQAQSQQDEEVEGEAGESNTIIVTAQKREQNLQEVPISILSFDSETLARSGVRASVTFR